MLRTIATLLFLIIFASAEGQSLSATETVKNYKVAQKRLLVINTAQFINVLTQGNLDQDSIVTMACRITGMPFLLPYNEGFINEDMSPGANLVNAGRITEAVAQMKTIGGEERIRLTVEIAIWYLHKDGTHNADLDSASRFIRLASRLSTSGKYSTWENECRFLAAELSRQRGNLRESREMFRQLAAAARQAGNAGSLARAYTRLAFLQSPADSGRLNLLKKALDLYRGLGLKEKQIELLWDISISPANMDFDLMEKDLRQVLSLQQATGFKHSLYTHYLLARVLANQANYLESMDYTNSALENLRWSGLTATAGAFYIRAGASYSAFGKEEEALQWAKKALYSGKVETHLFWYKSLFHVTEGLVVQMNKPAESLSVLKSFTAKFPPLTIWEKLHALLVEGECYERLNKPELAHQMYMKLLELALANPQADPYGELSGNYILVAQFYVSQNNIKKAHQFLRQSLKVERKGVWWQSYKYELLYKIDSLRGSYESAMENHIRYKYYYDSAVSMDQRKKMDELTIKYEAGKKDQDIKLLRQQGIVQQTELKQNKLTRNIMIAGTGLLLVIVALLFSQFKLKQRTNAVISLRNLALQHLVEEKEWLLKEVHHRVKNNLHTVICLLESQAAYLKNDALKAVETSQHRVYAMSLIHQNLYQSDDVKTIDMSVYLPEFIRYLDESFGTQYQVSFKLEIEPFKLGVSQAVPIALIVNEAVTNSIKYAFPQNKKGVIRVSMKQRGDQITLLIADNGIGIDPMLAKVSKSSLGLKLINGLSDDINATIEFQNSGGTTIIIRFDVDPLQNQRGLSGKIDKQQVYT